VFGKIVCMYEDNGGCPPSSTTSPSTSQSDGLCTVTMPGRFRTSSGLTPLRVLTWAISGVCLPKSSLQRCKLRCDAAAMASAVRASHSRPNCRRAAESFPPRLQSRLVSSYRNAKDQATARINCAKWCKASVRAVCDQWPRGWMRAIDSSARASNNGWCITSQIANAQAILARF